MTIYVLFSETSDPKFAEYDSSKRSKIALVSFFRFLAHSSSHSCGIKSFYGFDNFLENVLSTYVSVWYTS